MGTPPDYPPHALSRRGERLATQHLRSAGWTVVAKNYRFGRREIDLIVQKGPLLAFVEVKTRAGGGCGHPEEAVTWRKRREIEAVAEECLVRNARSGNQVRFDVIAIEVAADGRVTRLQHLEDAWRQGLAIAFRDQASLTAKAPRNSFMRAPGPQGESSRIPSGPRR